MLAFHTDQFTLPLPPGHRFPQEKYRRLRQRVPVEVPEIELRVAPAATDGELALAHTPGYVTDVAEGLLDAARQREIGFPWSPEMVERSRRSVGATIAAARTALAQGVAANLAGGTHHAGAAQGGGFCVFNDIAVAARLMQAEWGRHHRSLLRVAVIDLDVHQGNGTAAIFRDDPTVFTLSLHGEKNFPFRKEASDLDVALPDGCADAEYLDALDGALDRLWAHHADALPGLVFYLAGADAHEGDRLGRLKLTAAGMAERDRRVFAAARERRIPAVLTMGGGYGRVIDDTVNVQIGTLREAVGSFRRW
ncbi:histone deacetylase [Rhizobacter sp. Root1221]|uniref:histone deacetylase family protein n=1 Tax=Rhizobacter sp. Root1221 TaxID=1736433 RepID=UPI0006F361B3|nr:histone deacetylase [Rhizobacter sp. Root1221]KQW01633.1 deacetylase [Rhizobacter sp. Root1221]